MKYSEIDKGMTKTYQIFEEIVDDTRFKKHLEHYIVNFSASKDDTFVKLAGEVFEMVLMDKIKTQRLKTVMENYLGYLGE